MNFDQKKFSQIVPPSFKSAYSILRGFGMTPTLVGGVVRDFLLEGILGKDWDIELSHATVAFNKDDWKELGKKLSSVGRVSFLSYDVIRLDVDEYQFEFSPPRKEVFAEKWQAGGHSNFTVEFDFKLRFDEAVRRRDFTINAMGIRFLSETELEFLDPLQGLVHLRDKILCACSEDFEKDPVRFLRALRFRRKLGFEFSHELRKTLENMPVTTFTASYFWSEMQKSKDPIGFYTDVLKWLPFHSEMNLPVKEWNETKGEEFKRINVDPTKHESWIIAWEWVGISSESWQRYFSLSSDSCKRLGRWANSCLSFTKILPETFHGEFEEVRETKEFALLFDWYFTTKQLLQKNPELPLLKMIEEYLPDWIHLYRFEPVKDVKHIDPPFRAKYQVWNLCQRL